MEPIVQEMRDMAFNLSRTADGYRRSCSNFSKNTRLIKN
jgi:hypothetical protein